MPAELADTQITLKELGAFREVLRQLRALLVALEFIQNSSRTVTEADLHWVAEHILHTKLTKAQVRHLALSSECDRGGPALGRRTTFPMPACPAQGVLFVRAQWWSLKRSRIPRTEDACHC